MESGSFYARAGRVVQQETQMIEQTGTVIGCDGDLLQVRVATDQGCSRCAQGRGCGQGLMGELAGTGIHCVTVAAPVSETLDAGQQVVLGIAPRVLLSASIVIYMVPLMLMVLSAVVVHSLAGSSEAATIGAGVVGLMSGFAGVRVLVERPAMRRSMQPQLLRVVATPAEESVT